MGGIAKRAEEERETEKKKEFSHFPAKTNGSWEERGKADIRPNILHAHTSLMPTGWAKFGIQSFYIKYSKDTNDAKCKGLTKQSGD